MVKIVNYANSETCPIVLTVSHAKALKVNTRPLTIYRDEEVATEDIATTLARDKKIVAVINDTLSDPNKPDLYFAFDEKNKKEFFEAVEKFKPTLVIDIHGMSDIGMLFNNARYDGTRYFRYFKEKQVIFKRPDIDIEYKRKHGYTTCKGIIAVMLGNILAKAGFSVDFELVYPGGFVIERLSNIHTDALALEVNRNIRDDQSKLERLTNSLGIFIDMYLGKQPEEVINPEDYQDTEVIYQEMKEHLEAQQRMQRRATGGETSYIG